MTGETQAEPEQELFDEAYKIFLKVYEDNTCNNTYFYDGVEAGLDYLKKNKYKLGCVTNKREIFTHNILESLGIYNDFDIVISGDTLPKNKPDPMPLLHAAEFFKVKPENS